MPHVRTRRPFHGESVRGYNVEAQQPPGDSPPPVENVTSLVLRIKFQDEAVTMSRSDAMNEVRTKHGVKISKRSARVVENAASRDTISTLLLRNGYVLVKLECLILPDRVYVFDVQLPLVNAFATKMHDALQRSEDEHLSYPLRCLDNALDTVTLDYEKRLNVFQPVLNAVLASTGRGAFQTSEHALLRLLPLENALTKFHTSLQEFLSAVRDLANGGERIWEQLMPGNYPEVKLIAESYVKITEELVNEVNDFQRRIDATRDTIEAALDLQRNNILNLNIHISILALTTAIGALIAGIFGMNVTNYCEEAPLGFVAVVSGIGVVGVLVYGLMLGFYFRNLKPSNVLHSTISASDFYGKLNDQAFINTLREQTSAEHWAKVLQLAVGKRLRSEQDAQTLMRNPYARSITGMEFWDQDGDGFVTASEVEKVVTFFGDNLAPSELEALLKEVSQLRRGKARNGGDEQKFG